MNALLPSRTLTLKGTIARLRPSGLRVHVGWKVIQTNSDSPKKLSKFLHMNALLPSRTLTLKGTIARLRPSGLRVRVGWKVIQTNSDSFLNRLKVLSVKKILLVLFLFFTLQKVIAGGFQVNLQGNYQIAMAHCGTGLVTDAAGIFFNPGTDSFLKSTSVTVGINLIFHQTEYLEAYPGQYTSRTQNTIGTPLNFYCNIKFKKAAKLSAGLGIYTPFGSRIKYNDDWKGQFLLREIDLKTFFIQPTLSFKLNEKIGIGAGVVYATGSLKLRKGVPVQNSVGNYGEGKLEGKANGFGFNAGIYFQPSEKFSFGLSYRSAVKVKVTDGNATFTVPSSLEKYFPSTSFTTSITLPSVANFGMACHLNKKLILAFDLNYVGWKSYDTLSFDFKVNTEKLDDIHSPREYANAFIYRLGIEYKWNAKLSLRAGSYFDRTPVKKGYLTPETPDADKLSFTCGAGYNAGKTLHLDFSLLYTTSQERTDTNTETEFTGTWKSKAFVPGLNVTYKF